jgi:hypothetical protein
LNVAVWLKWSRILGAACEFVPGDAETTEEEACEAAAELLFPYMRSEDDPEADHHFDSFLQPDDLSGPDYVQLFWRADDIVERFAELQVKAIVTPDGRWHASEAEVWDDEAWVASARQILRQYPKCLALRHVLHI